MKRVLILGCPASGKSTFARALAVSTGLPVVHLDRLYWRANWVQATEEEFQTQLAAELAKDVWIFDGNYSSTIAPRLALADTAIFLDGFVCGALRGELLLAEGAGGQTWHRDAVSVSILHSSISFGNSTRPIGRSWCLSWTDSPARQLWCVHRLRPNDS